MSTESKMLPNHLILCRFLLLLPSISPSIKVFCKESAFCIRWPKCWNFRFSNSPSNEYSALISFRIYWFDLLAVQGTLNSLLQHLESINSFGTFFMIRLSHLYWNNHRFDYMDLCWQSDVSAFNTLARFVSFPSKEQASFDFMAAVPGHSDFGAQENKTCHCFHFFPFYSS